MNIGIEGELDAIARAVRGIEFAYEHQNQTIMRAIVETLASRPGSPLANAVERALRQELQEHDMI